MKKSIFALLAATTLCIGLTGCKSDNDTQADNNTMPDTSVIPNVSSQDRTVRVPADNGVVTDGNGIIGDDDDLVTRYERNNETPVERVGDKVSEIAEDTGKAVSDAAENVRDYVSDITDNSNGVVSDDTDGIITDNSEVVVYEASDTETSG